MCTYFTVCRQLTGNPQHVKAEPQPSTALKDREQSIQEFQQCKPLHKDPRPAAKSGEPSGDIRIITDFSDSILPRESHPERQRTWFGNRQEHMRLSQMGNTLLL